LKKTGVELELLTDIDMHLFVERGMRSGISMVSKRYAKVNNPYVLGYDPSKPTIFLPYEDVNNLYGWAMSKPLPKKRFQMEARHAHRGGDPEEKRKRKEWMDSSG